MSCIIPIKKFINKCIYAFELKLTCIALICCFSTSVWGQQVFDYTGGLQSYTVDANAQEGSQLTFKIKGGDGGRAEVCGCRAGGGNGAITEATITIGSNTSVGQIPPGTTLRFIVGGKGTDEIRSGCFAGSTGSGGGGTAVLANIDSTWQIIAVAGGGGGAYQGHFFDCVDRQHGQGGRATTFGGNGGGSSAGAAGSNGAGGNGAGSGVADWVDFSGGGGGAFSNGTGDNSTSPSSHHMGGKLGYPAGGAGGTEEDYAGGWGFGGGGSSDEGAGGGGGYSGGGGGTEFDNGGGGGSFANPLYTSGVNITAGSHDNNTEHGYIEVQHECTINVTGFDYINPLCTPGDQGRIQFNYSLLDTGHCDMELDWRLEPMNGWSYLGDGIFRSIRAGDYTLTVTNLGTGDVLEYDFTAGVTNERPVAVCEENITVTLGPDGLYIDPDFAQAMDAGSYHPTCDYVLELDAQRTIFHCGDVGRETPVILTVTAENGAWDYCTTYVTVLPYEGPTANCVPDFELDLEGQSYKSLSIDDINDNSSFFCEDEGTIRFAFGTDTSFNCDDLGQTRPLTLVMTDLVGNTSECTTMVTVIDSSIPVAICKDTYTLALQNGTAILDPAELDNGSYSNDQCGDLTFSADIETLTCDDVGEQQVTFTVTSASGNSDSCEVTLIVTENGEFTAQCQNITVALDDNGMYLLDPSEIENGSIAIGCAPPTFAISQDTFTCDNLGDNLVTLTMTSSDGLQTSSCEATVTVIDDIAPTFDTDIYDEITVDLRFGGSITSYSSAFSSPSSDNCSIQSQGFTGPTSFTCDQIGTSVPSSWTIEDQSGNTYVHNFVVHVINTREVSIACAPIDIDVTNVQGQYTLTDGDIYNILFNADEFTELACYDIMDLTLSQTTFDWAETPYSVDVTISLTDENGTEHSCTSAVNVNPIDTAFVMTFETSGTFETITIPTTGEGYNYSVNWGDGTIETGLTGDATHEYNYPAVYTVLITGDFPRIYFNNSGDKEKIRSVMEWGPSVWSSMESAFFGCSNLDVTAMDSPDLTNVTSMQKMFRGCTSLVGTTAFNDWNVTNVENMIQLFATASQFNINISNWNVSSVQFMTNMFDSALIFNQPIGNWNTGNVTHMGGMFSGAQAFNQDLNNWDVSSVEIMAALFANATNFNGDITSWNTNAATDMLSMFSGAQAFNRDISGWDTGNVYRMFNMFRGAEDFNQPIGIWNVSGVSSMRNMFSGALAFNQDLSNWDVSSVSHMGSMFNGAEDFDQDLSNWNIESLGTASSMFTDSGLSNANYDNLLIGWATLDTAAGETLIPSNINFGGGDSQYCLGETARNTLTDPTGLNWTITDGGLNCATDIVVAPKVYLQGAALNPNLSEETLMRDDLRVAGLLPTVSPYGDGATVDASVFDTTGQDAIVDWVWVELRDQTDNSMVIDSQSALLQRDGDVVGVDGISPLAFAQSEDRYYVVINHRNHIGVITAVPQTLNTSTSLLDLTSNPAIVEGGTNSVLLLPNGFYGMYTGDFDGNAQIQNSDASAVIQLIGGSGYEYGDMDVNTQIQNTDVNALINPNIGRGEQFGRPGIAAELLSSDVTVAFTNAEITNDGMDDYYEADIVISGTTDFYIGSGQVYLEYNTAAFGENVATNNSIAYSQPDGSILGYSFGAFSPAYRDFVQNDNTTSRVSLSFQQNIGLAGLETAPELQITSTPKVLFHIKIRYVDINADADICFYSEGVFQDQFFTACGGTATADCTNTPGVQITNDTYDCSEAGVGTLSITSLESEQILLYPNPTSSSFSIKGLTTTSQIRIYDVNGRLILEEQRSDDRVIDMSRYDNGVYLVEISNERGRQIKRLIKK
ncbi:BspA family leucine-rich repeat surface protein [Winogradskyella sp.]|uniref:BspA family leucine-rich repeat surface protein n=1 Tax=Winogradskyella sp. TaxID=1883156 RepID=UPI003BAA0FAA